MLSNLKGGNRVFSCLAEEHTCTAGRGKGKGKGKGEWMNEWIYSCFPNRVFQNCTYTAYSSEHNLHIHKICQSSYTLSSFSHHKVFKSYGFYFLINSFLKLFMIIFINKKGKNYTSSSPIFTLFYCFGYRCVRAG